MSLAETHISSPRGQAVCSDVFISSKHGAVALTNQVLMWFYNGDRQDRTRSSNCTHKDHEDQIVIIMRQILPMNPMDPVRLVPSFLEWIYSRPHIPMFSG